jgi:hypothetical protein
MKLFMPPTKNNSGVDIPKGSFVMATGAQGDRITIAKAVTDGSVDPEYMIGFAAQNIEDGSETGLVVINGTITNVDTLGWPVGTILYPNSASAGTLSASVGEAPDIRTPVAIVLREHKNSGRIYARVINSHKFGEEADVKLTSLSDGDIAIYNSASSLWMNESFDERAQDAIATMISNGTQTNLTIDYDDNANSLSFNVIGAVADVQGTTNEIEVTSASNIYTVGLPDDVTISNDLTVVGNLTVSGSVTYVNTTELLIEDNIVTLNSSASAPLLDAGIEVQRGSASNVYIKWDESSDVWQFTNDGSTYYDLVDFDTTLATKTTDDLTEGSNEYFTVERAQDAAASMITGGSHTNITVTYNDGTNTLDLTGSATVTDEQVQDAIAPLFTHAFHTNITATYDDANDRIVLVGSAAGGGGSAISTDVAISNSWWLGV